MLSDPIDPPKLPPLPLPQPIFKADAPPSAAQAPMHAGLVVVVLPLLLAIQNLWSLMVPFYVFVPGHGVHQPCGQSSAVTPFPAAAGAALALNGFFNGGRGFCRGQLANAAK